MTGLFLKDWSLFPNRKEWVGELDIWMTDWTLIFVLCFSVLYVFFVFLVVFFWGGFSQKHFEVDLEFLQTTWGTLFVDVSQVYKPDCDKFYLKQIRGGWANLYNYFDQ